MAGDLTFNKYAAAILATALGFMVIKEISHGMMHVDSPKSLAYCGDCKPKDEGKATEKELPFPQADWIAAMDVEKGKKYFAACSTCHTVNSGGDNLQGPNLWNVVGRKAGSIDYSYSSGMASMGIDWGYEELDKFLTRPAKYVKGTKMGYGGEKKPAKRAALIAYLRSLSDAPIAMPVAAAAPEAAPADDVEGISAPADGESTTTIEVIKDKMDGAADKMTSGAETVVEKVADGAEATMEKAGEMAGDLKDGAGAVADKVVEGAGEAADVVKDGAETVKDGAKDLLGKAKDVVDGDK